MGFFFKTIGDSAARAKPLANASNVQLAALLRDNIKPQFEELTEEADVLEEVVYRLEKQPAKP